MQQLQQNLIEKALALTGKTIDDMQEETSFGDMDEENGGYRTIVESKFSIEKFCFYLLSPEFVEKYMPILFPFEIIGGYDLYLQNTATDLGVAIHEYQQGNSQPLIDLLSKI